MLETKATASVTEFRIIMKIIFKSILAAAMLEVNPSVPLTLLRNTHTYKQIYNVKIIIKSIPNSLNPEHCQPAHNL